MHLIILDLHPCSNNHQYFRSPYIKCCVGISGNVDVLYWNRKWFFVRHVHFDSGFHVRWYPTTAPHGITGPLKGIPNRLSYGDSHHVKDTEYFADSSNNPWNPPTIQCPNRTATALQMSLLSLNALLCLCEGDGDVVGVATLLVDGEAQAFHDDQVVELRVQLGVQEVEGKDKEEQVEEERERRVKKVRPCIWLWMTNDETQILSQWSVRRHQQVCKSARYVQAQRMMCTTQASV